jgi:Arc/MetJ family transcription regulator
MRTTVSIDDELLAAAKQRASERGTTLGRVVDDALRRELAAPAVRDTVELPVFRGGTGLRPGVDPASNRALYELLDEGRPPELLR